MATQKIEIELNIPEGWEFVGYRYAKVGECSVDAGRAPYQTPKLWTIESAFRQFIVRMKRTWRPATIEDAVRAIRGEVVEARFRDIEFNQWEEYRLKGYVAGNDFPWKTCFSAFNYCEVLES